MEDFVVYTLGPALKRQRDKRSKEELKLIIRNIIGFLQNNNLLVNNVLAEGESLASDFKLLRSDLNDLGFEILSKDLTKWLDGVSCGKIEANDMSIFERKLIKLTKHDMQR